ncbi:MAG: hypothetical protein CL881_07250 [Dehalococcoidia bacterium]|nr:hypothetical protein [Dehalococcoidia bacterium]|tara:strand:- start:715 stop:924 length:210 start_codon:yes stop_codon:yes gene_type:complete
MKTLNRKVVEKKLKTTGKISFMCLFCYGVFTITKNHFCNEAASVDGVISPEQKAFMKQDYLRKKKEGLL